MNHVAALHPWFGNTMLPVSVAHLQLDSRKVCANDLFFALSKEDTVLKMHIAQAAKQGAVGVVVDSHYQTIVESVLPVFYVEHLREKLGAIAHDFYRQPSQACKVMGVTGTNGKTTCSHWLAQAWQKMVGNAAVIGTLGCGMVAESARYETGMTTPDVLSCHRLLADLVAQHAVMVAMEVSSHALDQQRVDYVQFDTAIFTNLTRDHLDYHGDMASYAKAKQKLFDKESLRLAVINSDDEFGRQLIQRVRDAGKTVLSYALENKTSDIGVERYEITGQGITASIRTPWGKGELQSKFPGGYNLLNTLAVVATLCGHGMRLDSVLDVVAQLQAVPGRTHIVSDKQDDVLVVVDYAHTPDALQKILQALRPQTAGVLWCVFGCGGNRDVGKRPQMAAIAERFSDRVVLTTDNPRHEQPADIASDVAKGFSTSFLAKKNHSLIEDRATAIRYAIDHAQRGDVVLLAGKGHETYQEINGQRLPFSDVLCAEKSLEQRRLLQKEVGA